MESDECLLLSSAGGRRDAGAGARLCARHRDRRARRGQGLGPMRAGGIRRGGRAHLVLRQCRAALRHRNLQDARLYRTVGRDHPRALWRHRRQAAAVPLRRAGQFAGPDRAAAGKQRRPHPARDAGGDAVERTRAPAPCSCRPGTRRSACRGRGTSNGRCACSRSSPTRPTCSNTATSSTARRRSPPRSPSSSTRRKRSSAASKRWAARSPRSRPAISSSNSSNSNSRRVEAIERGEQIVVGVNRFVETEPSPLADAAEAVAHGVAGSRDRADRAAQGLARRARRQGGRRGARRFAQGGENAARNIMPASIACAKAGVTTGEWGFALRAALRRIPRADRRRHRHAQRRRGPRRHPRRGRPRLEEARPAA